jgi:hypothetical protein
MRRSQLGCRNCDKYNLACTNPLPMCGRATPARDNHGAATMPFSKHVVDLAQIEVMHSAFQKVGDALDLKCGPDDPMTEIIVMKIIELAKAGEVDPGRICARVLAELARPPGNTGK